MEWEILETERMFLRKLTPSVYAIILERFSDAEIMELLFLNDAGSVEKEREKYRNGLQTHNRSFISWQMIEKQSGVCLGACGFHNWLAQHARAEIGYHLLHEEVKRRGFMSEAVGRILKYGFEDLELNRIEALVSLGNTPSLKILEKFGFKREGLLRSHYYIDGIFEDSLIFSLLAQDIA